MPTLAEQWVRQGKEAGRQEGTFIGMIQTCRTLLGEASEPDDLVGKSLDELRDLAERLQAQVQQRLSRG